MRRSSSSAVPNAPVSVWLTTSTIVVSKPERAEAAHALVDTMLADESKFMLTVFCGRDANADERAELENYLLENHPEAEVYVIDGGQEIYPYIFVAE